MRLLVQRVSEARVEVEGQVTGEIGAGLLVFAGLSAQDTDAIFPKMTAKLTGLRLFPGPGGNMDRSVEETAGGILLVSQFTLYADTRKGRRPSFTRSLAPEPARELFARFVDHLRGHYTAGPVATGEFGAMMRVSLLNEGPVTIWLDSEELFTS